MKAVTSNIFNVAVGALAFLCNPLSAADAKAPGIPNFHQVNEYVYRGGQPADASWGELARRGIKTVVDLRRDGEDGEHTIEAEARAVRAAGMRYISVPMKGAPAGPTHEQMAKILEALGSGERVFVHCKKGKDRTGTAIACYRIKYDRWDNEKALAEAKAHGIHWYEVGMKAYILSFDPASMIAAVTQSLERPAEVSDAGTR